MAKTVDIVASNFGWPALVRNVRLHLAISNYLNTSLQYLRSPSQRSSPVRAGLRSSDLGPRQTPPSAPSKNLSIRRIVVANALCPPETERPMLRPAACTVLCSIIAATFIMHTGATMYPADPRFLAVSALCGAHWRAQRLTPSSSPGCKGSSRPKMTSTPVSLRAHPAPHRHHLLHYRVDSRTDPRGPHRARRASLLPHHGHVRHRDAVRAVHHRLPHLVRPQARRPPRRGRTAPRPRGARLHLDADLHRGALDRGRRAAGRVAQPGRPRLRRHHARARRPRLGHRPWRRSRRRAAGDGPLHRRRPWRGRAGLRLPRLRRRQRGGRPHHHLRSVAQHLPLAELCVGR